jgi:hypothetical protein
MIVEVDRYEQLIIQGEKLITARKAPDNNSCFQFSLLPGMRNPVRLV